MTAVFRAARKVASQPCGYENSKFKISMHPILMSNIVLYVEFAQIMFPEIDAKIKITSRVRTVTEYSKIQRFSNCWGYIQLIGALRTGLKPWAHLAHSDYKYKVRYGQRKAFCSSLIVCDVPQRFILLTDISSKLNHWKKYQKTIFVKLTDLCWKLKLGHIPENVGRNRKNLLLSYVFQMWFQDHNSKFSKCASNMQPFVFRHESSNLLFKIKISLFSAGEFWIFTLVLKIASLTLRICFHKIRLAFKRLVFYWPVVYQPSF